MASIARLADCLAPTVLRFAERGEYFDTTPAPVTAKTRQLLLDTFGCILAGRSAPEVAGLESEFSSLESGAFSFPGGRRLSVLGAAAVGAVAAGWDGASAALGDGDGPGAVAVAALLPQVLARDVRLDAFVDSLIAGYEVGARAGLALPGESPQRILNAGQALAAASAVSHLIGLPGGLRLSAVEAVIGWLSAGLPPGLPHQGNRVQAAHVAWGSTLAVLSAAGGLQVRQEALAPKAYPAQPEENSYRIVDAALKRHAGARHVQGCVEIGRVMRDRVRGKTE